VKHRQPNATARRNSACAHAIVLGAIGLMTPWPVIAGIAGASLGFWLGWHLHIPGSHLLQPTRAARARTGLWLGPGSLAALVLTLTVLSAQGALTSPSPIVCVVLLLAPLATIFCQLFSFAEMVGSLRSATRPPRSAAAVFLLLYWIAAPASIAILVWTHR